MKLLNTREAALAWLYQDELINLMSIDMLERALLEIAYSGTNSLLLADETNFMIHCREESEWPGLIARLLEIMPTDHFIILRAHEEWYLDDLIEQTGFSDLEPYLNSIYPEDFSLSEDWPEGVKIRPLTMEQFDFVRSTYLTVDSDDYIRERIEDGMLGAWYHGELAGFIGTHDEGTVGLLEVLPAFRRKGIARALESEMVRRLRNQNRRAHGNIAVDNLLSKTVHEKIGVRIAQQPVYWLFPPEY